MLLDNSQIMPSAVDFFLSENKLTLRVESFAPTKAQVSQFQ